MSKPVVLLDMNNLAHRNYHGNNLATSTGQPTGLVFGCLNSVLHVKAQLNPAAFIAVWDTKHGSGWRKEMFPGYKAHREVTEHSADFYEQVNTLKPLLMSMGIPNVQSEHAEADDVIGYLAGKISAAGTDVVILSNDGDFYQLITMGDESESHGEGTIRVFHPKNGLMGEKEVMQDPKYGVRPNQVASFKALTGDSSDEYKGAPGIGPKTAQLFFLVNKTIDGLFTHPMSINLTVVSPRQAATILKHRDEIKLCYELAKISPARGVVPCPRFPEKDLDYIEEEFKLLEFGSYLPNDEGRGGRLSEIQSMPEGCHLW